MVGWSGSSRLQSGDRLFHLGEVVAGLLAAGADEARPLEGEHRVCADLVGCRGVP